MSACDFYSRLKLHCPSYVHVGAVGSLKMNQTDFFFKITVIAGVTDIVPLGALLLSAGINSLDEQSVVAYAREVAGHHHPNTTYRAAGMLLIVYIEYRCATWRDCCLSLHLSLQQSGNIQRKQLRLQNPGDPRHSHAIQSRWRPVHRFALRCFAYTHRRLLQWSLSKSSGTPGQGCCWRGTAFAL